MKYNPITKKLFTNDNILIKKLDCPLGISWDDLLSTQSIGTRSCNICDKNISDTALLAGKDVLQLIKKDPAACLKVDLNQENIRVVNCDV